MRIVLIDWFLSALSLMIVAYVIPGFQVSGVGTALIAVIVIGLVNATLGFVLKVLALPVTVLTFGLFLFVINAFMLRFAAVFVSGFVVQGFLPAFFGAIVLALVGMALRAVVFES